MRKWIILCLTLLISFTLVACNSKEEIVTLQAEEQGIILKLTYKAEGDKVIEQTADNVMPYESLGLTTAEEAKEIFGDAVAEYEGVKGVKHSMDYQEDKAVESLTINYAEADLEEVSHLVGTMFDGDTSEGISLKKSIEMLEEQGFEVVE